MPRVPGFEKLVRVGEMGEMAIGVIRTMFVPPYWWLPDFTFQSSKALRRCFLPAVIGMVAFAIGLAADFFGGIVRLLGTPDRLGGGIGIGFLREPGVWVAIMILAGVAGTAVTADLGARKIREELDALKVLGVEEMRGLILPRVLALTLVGPILGFITVTVSWTSVYLVTPIVFPSSVITHAAFLETFKAFVSPLDLINFIIKCAVAGFLVGVVSCYKGIRASGGAEGVGRAVNEAVLISFFGVWVINILFNTMFLSLFPSVTQLRG
jgi:phospholipid/cholesterol/gamma-HCH transport system permease protein